MPLGSFLTIAAIVSFGQAILATQSDQPTPPIDQLDLGGGLVWLRPDTPIGNQSTLLLKSNNAALMVDANIDSVAPELERIFGKSMIFYVVTTHHHGDHTQGLEHLAGHAVTIAPTDQIVRLRSTPLTGPGSAPLNPAAIPRIGFDQRLELRVGSQNVELLRPPHRNGHTDGDALAYFPHQRVLYVGDYFFAGHFPIIDVEGGGSFNGYFANIDWILDYFPAETRIIPGHANFAPSPMNHYSMTDLKSWAKDVHESLQIVQEYIAAGLTIEEAVNQGLPERFAPLGMRPRYLSTERWIRSIYKASAPISQLAE